MVVHMRAQLAGTPPCMHDVCGWVQCSRGGVAQDSGQPAGMHSVCVLGNLPLRGGWDSVPVGREVGAGP